MPAQSATALLESIGEMAPCAINEAEKYAQKDRIAVCHNLGLLLRVDPGARGEHWEQEYTKNLVLFRWCNELLRRIQTYRRLTARSKQEEATRA